MKVPKFLLKKFVVKGSFRTTEEGYCLKLQNKLGLGTMIGMSPVKVDEIEFAPETVSIKKSGRIIPGQEISEANPLTVAFGEEMLLMVKTDRKIAPGSHRIQAGLKLVGVGVAEVDYEDELA